MGGDFGPLGTKLVRKVLGEDFDAGLGDVVSRITTAKLLVGVRTHWRYARRTCDALLGASIDDQGWIFLEARV